MVATLQKSKYTAHPFASWYIWLPAYKCAYLPLFYRIPGHNASPDLESNSRSLPCASYGARTSVLLRTHWEGRLMIVLLRMDGRRTIPVSL